jgi:hypothetical protein
MHHSKKTEKARHQRRGLKNTSVLRRLLAATLSVSGAWQLLPLLAQAQSVPLTPAGQTINNTATGTYEDPNNPGVPINTTSNTVTVTVTEVAGITVVGNGISDSSPATPVLPEDVLTYSFLITNVGNDATTVQIPAPVLTGPATLGATITYAIDNDGNGTVDSTTTVLATATAAVLQVGGTIRVSVPVTVAISATSGAPIRVQLGDTTPNTTTGSIQNQPWDGTGNDDVRTKDNANGVLGETAGVLGDAAEREASAVQTILVGATPQAFAAVLKTRSATTPPVPVSNFDAVLVPYNLSLKVDSAAPAGASASLTPTDLVGTSITLEGSPVTKVLVSDVIPDKTTLVSVTPPDPSWTVVYTPFPLKKYTFRLRQKCVPTF